MIRSAIASIAVLGPAATTAGPGHTQEPAVAAAEPTLRQADGTLEHLFTVSFAVDAATLATVRGLSGMGVARTAAGGEIEITFPPGVPYPRGTAPVTVREVPEPRNRTVLDHLAPPPGIAERQGQELVTSHQMAVRSHQYLTVWRDRSTGEHSVTVFDTHRPQAAQPTIARSPAAIIGVARSPFKLAANYYLTVWVVPQSGVGPEGERQVLVESYIWKPPA